MFADEACVFGDDRASSRTWSNGQVEHPPLAQGPFCSIARCPFPSTLPYLRVKCIGNPTVITSKEGSVYRKLAFIVILLALVGLLSVGLGYAVKNAAAQRSGSVTVQNVEF
jgi:hypothetical protein